MPRPTTKAELLEAATVGRQKILDWIAETPPELLEAEFAFADRDRSIRDVIVHLNEWHKMMLRWYTEGQAGQQPQTPAPGYTWATTPALNAVIQQHAQQIPLSAALAEFETTHEELLAIIAAHSGAELFTKQHYPWTGSTSLGAYLISATSSHYDWAIKKLRKARKTWA